MNPFAAECGSGNVLAVEGGATQTRAGLYGPDGALKSECIAGPCNPTEYGVAATAAALVRIAERLDARGVDTLVASLAGAGRVRVRSELAERLAQERAARRVIVTNDLYPLLAANSSGGGSVLAIAGTGSCVMALSARGDVFRAGGRGRVFGDAGGGYGIAEAALRAAGDSHDGIGPVTDLVERLPAALGLGAFAELVPWSLAATKREIAALSEVVDASARAGEVVALRILEEQAVLLVKQTCAVLRSAELGDGAPILISGGVFSGSALFREAYGRALAASGVESAPAAPGCLGHRAVMEMWRKGMAIVENRLCTMAVATSAAVDTIPATEAAVPGVALDALTALEIVRAMSMRDEEAVRAVRGVEDELALLIETAARCVRGGGRIIYVGAGTSGRLGVLDASECPPTFGVGADVVMGLIAGGERAVRNSVEGAEDDTDAAVRDMDALRPGLSGEDLVVGVAASGRTPYVLAALDRARASGATTALVSCAPVERVRADHVIVADTGAEALPGSTRLKAGTATKLILNAISTGALALAGYVYQGQMVGVRPVNAKLRARATRILASIAGVSAGESGRLLEAARGDIRVAVLMHRGGLAVDEAERRLDDAGGRLREALERL